MQNLAASANRGRGSELLLEHCGAMSRLEDARPPAFSRLEEAVGGELARMLVLALADRRRRVARVPAT